MLTNLQIKKSNYLSSAELQDLKDLAHVCYENDGILPIIYWDAISKKREIAGSFLCYDAGILIGYLDFFLFDDDAVHISAMVNPKYRNKGLFSWLLKISKQEITKLKINRLIIPIHDYNYQAKTVLLSLKAEFLYAEYSMFRSSATPEILTTAALTFTIATDKDTQLIAEIDSACFGINYNVTFEKFKQISNDKYRVVFLAYLADECVGKGHIHIEGDRALIHDICILPPYQNKGYATNLLQFMVNYLINNDQIKMYLEVTVANKAALKLYEKCGFKVEGRYDYFLLKL